MHTITYTKSFVLDLIQLRKPDQKKVLRAMERIVVEPFGGDCQKLKSASGLPIFRSKVSDKLRIAYTVQSNSVCFLHVGYRSEFYEKNLEHTLIPEEIITILQENTQSVDLTSKTVKISAESNRAANLPAASDPSRSLEDMSWPGGNLLKEILDTLGVPPEYHDAVISCETLDKLLDADMPDEIKERIIHRLYPPTIEERLEEPIYELPTTEYLEQCVEESLSCLLLRLDEEQKRAASSKTQGPLLVKGGPGTGKSIVALYRIRNLYKDGTQQLFNGEPPHVLFITYTKALTRVSKQLLTKLLGTSLVHYVDIDNIDHIAWSIASEFAQQYERDKEKDLHRRIAVARDRLLNIVSHRTQTYDTLVSLPTEYLFEEFDWVIDGRGITRLDDYLSTRRTGRGTRFGPELRHLIWRLYNTWLEDLQESKIATYTQVQLEALKKAENIPESDKYDIVVLDEAQDLKPVGIRLAMALCKNPSGFYLTADENQSIYGRGYSWRQVSDDLRIQGRTIILKRNYRTTKQIQEAALQFMLASGIDDPDSHAVPVKNGPKPVIALCNGNEAAVISSLFRQWQKELRLPIWISAVLVPTNRLAEQLAGQLIQHGIPARAFGSKNINIDDKVVKVITIHTAKGLEFPMVAVAGLTDDLLPRKSYKPVDPHDWEEHVRQGRKLLHVAMTRAMERLVLCKPVQHPSPFFDDLDQKLWMIIRSDGR